MFADQSNICNFCTLVAQKLNMNVGLSTNVHTNIQEWQLRLNMGVNQSPELSFTEQNLLSKVPFLTQW